MLQCVMQVLMKFGYVYVAFLDYCPHPPPQVCYIEYFTPSSSVQDIYCIVPKGPTGRAGDIVYEGKGEILRKA